MCRLRAMKKKQRRPRLRDDRDAGYSGRRVPVNDHIDAAAIEDVLRAVQRFADVVDWPTLAPNVVPLFPRRRPTPVPGQPLQVLLPPGIMTGFGVDAGPAVMHVGVESLAGWGVDVVEVTARALENVRLRSAPLRPRDLVAHGVGGVAIRALQSGQGIASTLLLVPDELRRIFGERPQTFVAPMRDLLVSVGGDVDPEYFDWLNEEFALLDPNALALDAFALEDGELRLRPLARAAMLA